MSSHGPIVAIGGAEERSALSPTLRHFVELAGGADARIAILPTASQLEETGASYEQVFGELGVQDAEAVPFDERSDCDDVGKIRTIEAATGVFITGGNQLRLSTILGGTSVAELLRARNDAGIPVGGTSAGAAILSEHMIAYGDDGSIPRAGAATLAPGLGLLPDVIVDQHFWQRNRLGRLLSALSYNPRLVGVGVDEDTAAVVSDDNTLHVLGRGAVTIVDASEVEYSSMAEARQGEPVSLTGVRLHVLTDGAQYSLDRNVVTQR